jgi:hypothetical protein
MVVRSSNRTHLRALGALLVAVVPLAPCFVSGCGSSGTTPTPVPMASATASATATATGDATVPLVMVVTSGGGDGTSSSSSGGTNNNPFGTGPDSGSSSGGTDAMSGDDSSGGGPSGDDSGSDDAGDASDANAPDSSDGTLVCQNYVAPMCGTTPCDLRANTCCISLTLTTRCIAGANANCNSNEASIHCLQACECGGGKSCCGVENTLVGFVTSQCQNVPAGGYCSPHPQTTTQASAQLCTLDAECRDGSKCINQTCIYGANLNICGVQSQDPFDCAAN